MGIPTEVFLKQPPDENLICSICHDVFDDPVSIPPCGHTFCKLCLQQVQGTKCPSCRQEFRSSTSSSNIGGRSAGGGRQHPTMTTTTTTTTTTVSPNLVARSMVGELQMICQYGNTTTQRSVNHDDEEVAIVAVNGHCDDGSNSKRRKVVGQQHMISVCQWKGKVSDWKIHIEKNCPLHIITCPIVGCQYQCQRQELNLHLMNAIQSHVQLMISSQIQTLHTEYTIQLQQMKQQLELQFEQKLVTQHYKYSRELIHMKLQEFCCKWLQCKPIALYEFDIYRPYINYYPYKLNPNRMNQLLIGIPGPKQSLWEGGMYPILLEWKDVIRPPICLLPPQFYHPNVHPISGQFVTTMYKEKLWHTEISIPEILFNLQQLLVHPSIITNTTSNNNNNNNNSNIGSSGGGFGGLGGGGGFGTSFESSPPLSLNNMNQAYRDYLGTDGDYTVYERNVQTMVEKYAPERFMEHVTAIWKPSSTSTTTLGQPSSSSSSSPPQPPIWSNSFPRMAQPEPQPRQPQPPQWIRVEDAISWKTESSSWTSPDHRTSANTTTTATAVASSLHGEPAATTTTMSSRPPSLWWQSYQPQRPPSPPLRDTDNTIHHNHEDEHEQEVEEKDNEEEHAHSLNDHNHTRRNHPFGAKTVPDGMTTTTAGGTSSSSTTEMGTATSTCVVRGGSRRCGDGKPGPQSCPCSCCAWGVSFWDTQREMRFFFGS